VTDRVAQPAAQPEAESITAAHRIAAGVAAEHAAAVDRGAAFPDEAIRALAGAGLLMAVVPAAAGGLGSSLPTLARIASTLARACGSTAMIWAMHQSQLACVLRHGAPEFTTAVSDLLSTIVTDNLLLASVASEKGIGGDITRSRACVEPGEKQCSLVKDAPTVSYGEHAGAFLVSARRGPTAPEDDQVAVLVHRDQLACTRTSRWNPMGMRGTCSPGFLVRAQFDAGQILPHPFGVIATRTLIPMSEVLWSSVWIGMATEALDRATSCLDARGSRSAATVDRRLARADQIVTGLDAQLSDAIAWFESVERGDRPADRRFRMRMHALKLAASTSTVEVAQHALAMCGIAGYQEDGPYSIARLLRDLYSAQIMVSNDRLLDVNAEYAISLRAGDGGHG
jgi:acyl-CoA dehydrogenase